MYVTSEEHDTGTLHDNPKAFMNDNENNNPICCNHPSVITFREEDTGTLFHACGFHAPEEKLKELGVEIPEGRHREGRIRV